MDELTISLVCLLAIIVIVIIIGSSINGDKK